MKFSFVLLGLALSVASTTNVHAQSPEKDSTTSEAQADAKRSSARQLATEASADYRASRFGAAYDKFNRAFKLVGVPALGVWSARSLRQQDRLVEASERYREVLKKGAAADAPESHRKSLKDARAELDELLPLIPNLLITLENATADTVKVSLDGIEVDTALVGVKQRVDPGTHKITGTRESEVVKAEITLTERQTESTVLTFRPGYVPKSAAVAQDSKAENSATKDPGKTRRIAGIVTMSAGGAFLIGGIITTMVGLNQKSKLKVNCPNLQCTPEFHSDVDSYNTMKTISMVGLVGAGVLGAVGATLYFTAPKASGPKDMALYVRGTQLGFRGAF